VRKVLAANEGGSPRRGSTPQARQVRRITSSWREPRGPRSLRARVAGGEGVRGSGGSGSFEGQRPARRGVLCGGRRSPLTRVGDLARLVGSALVVHGLTLLGSTPGRLLRGRAGTRVRTGPRGAPGGQRASCLGPGGGRRDARAPASALPWVMADNFDRGGRHRVDRAPAFISRSAPGSPLRTRGLLFQDGTTAGGSTLEKNAVRAQ